MVCSVRVREATWEEAISLVAKRLKEIKDKYGSNSIAGIASINPILGLQIRACSRKGGNILTIGYIKGFKNFTPISLSPELYTEAVLLEGIVTELKNRKGLSNSNQRLEAKIKDINTTIEGVVKKCNVSEKDFTMFVDILSESLNPAVVIGKEIAQIGFAEFRKRYEDLWKTVIPEKPGLSIFEMQEGSQMLYSRH